MIATSDTAAPNTTPPPAPPPHASPPVLPYVLTTPDDALDRNPWLLRGGVIYSAAWLLLLVLSCAPIPLAQLSLLARLSLFPSGASIVVTALTIALGNLAMLLSCAAALKGRASIAGARRIAAIVACVLFVLRLSQLLKQAWQIDAWNAIDSGLRILLIHAWPLAMAMLLRPAGMVEGGDSRRAAVPALLLRASAAILFVQATLATEVILGCLLANGAVAQTGAALRALPPGYVIEVSATLGALALCILALGSRARRRDLVTIAMWLAVAPIVVRSGHRALYVIRSPTRTDLAWGILQALFDPLYAGLNYVTLIVLTLMLWRQPESRAQGEQGGSHSETIRRDG